MLRRRAILAWPPAAMLLAMMGSASPAANAQSGVNRASAASEAASEEIAVVVNPTFPSAYFDAARLEAIFTATARSGPDGKPLIVFTFPPDDKLRIEFDRVVLRMTPDQVSRYWIDQRIRSGQRPPRQIADPTLVMRLVGKLSGSIGYLPRRLIDKTVRVVALIRAGKVVPYDQ